MYVVGEVALLDSAQRPNHNILFETRYYELLAGCYTLVEMSWNEGVLLNTKHAQMVLSDCQYHRVWSVGYVGLLVEQAVLPHECRQQLYVSFVGSQQPSLVLACLEVDDWLV